MEREKNLTLEKTKIAWDEQKMRSFGLAIPFGQNWL
jgi:hypothetical protein